MYHTSSIRAPLAKAPKAQSVPVPSAIKSPSPAPPPTANAKAARGSPTPAKATAKANTSRAKAAQVEVAPLGSPPRSATRTQAERDPCTYSKAELDSFGHQHRKAPQDVKDGWKKVASLAKNDPSRHKLFMAIKEVKRMDYSECRLIIEEELIIQNGICSHASPTHTMTRWPLRPY